jgi:hypothetical protein
MRTPSNRRSQAEVTVADLGAVKDVFGNYDSSVEIGTIRLFVR